MGESRDMRRQIASQFGSTEHTCDFHRHQVRRGQAACTQLMLSPVPNRTRIDERSDHD